MKILSKKTSKGLYTVIFLCQFIVACGGGSVSGNGSTSNGGANLGPFVIVSPDPVTSPVPSSASSPAAATPLNDTSITSIKIDNTTGSTQSNIPITLGHAFKESDVPNGNSVTGRLSNNDLIPLQVNIKVGHTSNNSVRHAVISAVLPSLAANATETIRLLTTSSPVSVIPIPAGTFLSTNPGFSSRVYIRVGAEVYSASARSLLAGSNIQWLAGPIANEWIVSGPLLKISDNVTPHPHLTVRFAIRSFTGSNKTKVDVTLENNKTFTASSRNFTYDSKIFVGGAEVDSITALKHYHHARWHKSFWWGDVPEAHIKHNTAYLISTKAVPNYDPLVMASESAIAQLATTIAGHVGPMKRGLLTYNGMGTAGGRPDIGPLPGWYVLYLLSMDKRAKDAMLATADTAGSWPIHLRDETVTGTLANPSTGTLATPASANNTFDMPVRIDKAGNAANGNPYTHISVHENAFGTGPIPDMADRSACRQWDTRDDCFVPLRPDTAHQPSLAYLPYLVTGDYFYLEELQFWAAWNFLGVNGDARGDVLGLVTWQEVRGQGWSMRTLGHTAYITPDAHPLKTYFNDRVVNNINYYDNTYRASTGVHHNQLGVVFSFYDEPNAKIRPWMDDFLTWSIGYLVELGFTEAQTFLPWKSRFVIGRMNVPVTTADYCWITASAYVLTIRQANASPVFSTFADVHTNSFGMIGSDLTMLSSKTCASQDMANWLTANSTNTGDFDNWGSGTYAVNSMIGYAGEPIGLPANMQPGLAVSVTSASIPWTTFMNRSGKPDYTAQPQFAIVPRN